MKLNKKQNNSGAILVMVIVCTLILTALGVAYLHITERERIYALKMIETKDAFYMAEAGMQRAQAWLMTRDKSPELEYGVNVFDPFDGENGVSNSEGVYKVSIDPDNANTGLGIRRYVIYSTGTVNKAVPELERIKTIKSEVIIQNFINYAYFSVNEDVDSGRKYFHHLESFDGWVRSNDVVSLYGHPELSTHSAIPVLYDISTADDFYFHDTGYSDGGGNDITLMESDYPAVLPSAMYQDWQWNFDRIAKADLAGSGLMRLSLAGEHTIKFSTDSIQYDNLALGTHGSWAIPDDGGVVFVSSNVSVYSNIGQGFDKWITIASSGSIIIQEDIKYDTGNPGMIGLVANVDIVIDQDSFIEDDIQIDAAMIANSKFRAKNAALAINSPSITINGCLIQNTRGSIGAAPTLYTSTHVATGYYFDIIKYDDRLLENPPPLFPKHRTSNTLSWEEKLVK